MHTNLVVMHDNSYIIIDDNDIKYYGNYLILKKGKIYYNGKECHLHEFLKEIEYA